MLPVALNRTRIIPGVLPSAVYDESVCRQTGEEIVKCMSKLARAEYRSRRRICTLALYSPFDGLVCIPLTALVRLAEQIPLAIPAVLVDTHCERIPTM